MFRWLWQFPHDVAGHSLIFSLFWQILGIDNLVHGNMNIVPSSNLATIVDVKIEVKIEERREKLSRYRTKRKKRNYGRKIKVNFLSSYSKIVMG